MLCYVMLYGGHVLEIKGNSSVVTRELFYLFVFWVLPLFSCVRSVCCFLEQSRLV